MRNLFTHVIRDEKGQDLIEYALLASLISVASIFAITVVGTSLQAHFTTVADAIP
jgi:pilus assembly protein Flp/PilA